MKVSARKTSTPRTTIDSSGESCNSIRNEIALGGVLAVRSSSCQGKSLNRSNGLYLIIGALVVIVIGLGAYLYREEKKPDGIQMNIDKNGVSVQQN
jgi:hypothetical protein